MKPFSAEDSAQTRSLSRHSGFVIGSKILTLDGELPVEFLSVGDRVITRDTGLAVLREIHVFEVECAMVWIMGGSLGHNKPDEDTKIAAEQKLLLRDWRSVALTGQKQALVAAEDLVDGEFVRTAGIQNTKLFQLVFDATHVIYADGLELACELTQGALRTAA
jgi:Hint domain